MEDSCDKVTDSEGVNANWTDRQQEQENASSAEIVECLRRK